jgi:hypothetical protein
LLSLRCFDGRGMGWFPDLASDGRHAVAPGGPGLLPWPVDREMQHQTAGGGGDAGRDGDEGVVGSGSRPRRSRPRSPRSTLTPGPRSLKTRPIPPCRSSPHIVDRIGARDHASDQRGQLLASRPYRSAHSTAAVPASRPAASANLSIIGISLPPTPDSAQQTSSPGLSSTGWFTGYV